MYLKNFVTTIALLLLSNTFVSAFIGGNKFHGFPEKLLKHSKRVYYPKPAEGVQTITTPTGVQIRYKQPGKEGVCETTPGVNSYSGYIDLAPNVHVFFWFFESRSNPAADPLTLWLNGGPGSDSLIGLFQELGPCRINHKLESYLNPYSWNDVSNMLFLSQPVGTGFSYQHIANGSVGGYTGTFLNASQAPPTGTYPILDPVNYGEIDTTDLAAMAAWHVLQGFLSGSEQLGLELGTSKEFNLFTESYGGHYGPAFFNYFQEQNAKVVDGSMPGYPLNMNSLGLINAIIDEYTQAPYYPEFATKNTYGIEAYNSTVYDYATFALNWPGGCLSFIETCVAAAGPPLKGGLEKVGEGYAITNLATSEPAINTLCSEAADMCRDNVESPYYYFSGRGTYDIRHPSNDPTPPENFVEYLQLPEVQNALGVSVNYTESNSDIYWQFQSTGDFIFPNFLSDLENILASGVRVSMIYGDADYICNWFGGEAASLAVKYEHQKQFAAAGYQPMMYAGVQYGETREYGNFSFTRIYEAGHEVPYYQPAAALALFNRTINLVDIPTGMKPVTGTLESNGPADTTHTQKPVPLFTGTGNAYKVYSSKEVKSYATADQAPPASSVYPGNATR